MKISIIINLDSRKQNDKADTMFNGTVNWDYWKDGVFNKIQFLKGFLKEVIIYGDVHNQIPIEILNHVYTVCDVVCLRQHTNENSFNDWNYYRALSLASGDYVMHFDQDTAAFTSSPEPIHEMIKLLDKYAFICYPSHTSPYPAHDDSFEGKFWASTRFFLCKRETLKLDELKKCIENPDWMYQKYGDSPRRCNWTEHFLAKINGNSVFYPAMNLDSYAIFSWASYKAGLLSELNDMNYSEIRQWLNNHPIIYPNDIHV